MIVKRKPMVIMLLVSIVFSGIYALEKPLQENGTSHPDISQLSNEIYYFPVQDDNQAEALFQPLQRFDLVFAGHNVDLQAAGFDKVQNLAALTPGKYTHVFAYMGKDENGLAYGVEMNVDKRQDFRLVMNGLKVSGKFYLHCLGSDFNNNSCPASSFLYGLNSYDYMTAKRLKPELHQKLLKHESQLMKTMAEDLEQGYPFQVPLAIDLKNITRKTVYLLDDGRKNGADCSSYFVSLFEEVADVCIEGARLQATDLSDYFLNDRLGRRAVIPAQYNPVLKQTVTLSSVLGEMGYALKNNSPRPSRCSGQQSVLGIPTPDALFNSPSLVSIATGPVNRVPIQLAQKARP